MTSPREGDRGIWSDRPGRRADVQGCATGVETVRLTDAQGNAVASISKRCSTSGATCGSSGTTAHTSSIRHTAILEAPLHRRGPLFGQQPLLLLRHLRLRHLVRNPRRQGSTCCAATAVTSISGTGTAKGWRAKAVFGILEDTPSKRCLVQHQRRALLLRPYRRG